MPGAQLPIRLVKALSKSGILPELSKPPVRRPRRVGRPPATPRAAALEPEPRPELAPVPARPGDLAPGTALETCLAELVRYCRHASAGRLLTGVLHQMNSPLQVLSFQLELLEQNQREELASLAQAPPPPPALEASGRLRLVKFQEVRQALEQLQTLTRRLILQGRHEETTEKLYLDLNRLYQEELELYQANPFFKHKVEKVFRFEADLPPIRGYYLDFSQSFRNLIDNALEAMEGAPRRLLTVETAFQEGGRILLIGDTGSGIPPEVLPRVFDPFFTTKSTLARPRAGLGLFLARRLLAPYQGRLQIYSRPGQTWVTVTLPVSPEEPDS
jgi:signal transduction histidine kinase